MLASWMAWAVGIGALLVITAVIAEKAFSVMRWPRRWLWVAALGAAVLLPLAVPFPTSSSGQQTDSDSVVRLERVTPASASSDRSAPRMSDIGRFLALGWLGGSTIFFGYLLYSAARLRRKLRRWPTLEIEGRTISVADATGPALVGVVRPRVTIPEWLVGWEEADRALVLRHEFEHAKAGDPRVNAFGLAVLGAMPWNPFLWWARRRLVQAIELDCDARVLRTHPDPRSYAEVLLEVARWTVPIRPVLPTLTVTNSQLERRIDMAMQHDAPRRVLLGASILGIAGVLAVALVPALRGAPERPSPSYLAGAVPAAQETPDEQVPPDLGGGPIPGRLPFTPTPEQMSTALAIHHPRILGRGLDEDQRVWFVIDEEMRILHTGVGPADGLHERVRSLHPESVTDYALALDYETVDGLELHTVWFTPEVPEG